VKGITRAGLVEAGTNLSLALLYGLFAWAHLRSFAAHPRPSLLMLVTMEALVAVLFLLREPARRSSRSFYAVATTAGGTLTPLLFRPTQATADFLIGDVLQTAGALLGLLAIFSLSRSFGLLPAARAIRVRGAYRWVRHPLYAAYTVMNVGYLLSNRSPANAALVATAFLFQVLRVRNEEALLSADPSYASYMLRTRWRLVPFLY
jgi:protein-S-isoprenylcysteine O-methyltransferase Ste14